MLKELGLISYVTSRGHDAHFDIFVVGYPQYINKTTYFLTENPLETTNYKGKNILGSSKTVDKWERGILMKVCLLLILKRRGIEQFSMKSADQLFSVVGCVK